MSIFTDIVGHQDQLQALEQDVAQGNVSHAYLLAGPNHIGKRTIAKQFATALLSKDLSEEQKNQQAKKCKKLLCSDFIVLDMLYRAGEQTDWSTIAQYSNAPQEHRKKSQAKTNTISIDDVRALQEVLYDTPVGPYRVCIITNVERMNTASANAFLKILEEPPSHLVFILTCDAISKLLPTVISRTRLITFSTVDTVSIRSILTNLDPLDQEFVIQLAQGAPGLAVSLRNDPDTLRQEKTLHNQAKQFWQAQSNKDRVQLLQPLHKRTSEADNLWLHIVLAARQLPYNQQRYNALLHTSTLLPMNVHRGLLVQNFIQAVSDL